MPQSLSVICGNVGHEEPVSLQLSGNHTDALKAASSTDGHAAQNGELQKL